MTTPATPTPAAAAADSPADPPESNEPLYVETTRDCLYCLGTGREFFTLGLLKCGHCHGTGKRTLRRRLTHREAEAIARVLDNLDEDADDDTADGDDA